MKQYHVIIYHILKFHITQYRIIIFLCINDLMNLEVLKCALSKLKDDL